MSTKSNGSIERICCSGTVNQYGAVVRGDVVVVERDGSRSLDLASRE
jgi:hypothetical protein